MKNPIPAAVDARYAMIGRGMSKENEKPPPSPPEAPPVVVVPAEGVAVPPATVADGSGVDSEGVSAAPVGLSAAVPDGADEEVGASLGVGDTPGDWAVGGTAVGGGSGSGAWVPGGGGGGFGAGVVLGVGTGVGEEITTDAGLTAVSTAVFTPLPVPLVAENE